MKMHIEYTDTFGGEANYAWVRRAEIDVADDASDQAIIRAAKSALGISGRHRKVSHNPDCLELRMVGECTVIFISCDYIK